MIPLMAKQEYQLLNSKTVCIVVLTVTTKHSISITASKYCYGVQIDT